MTWCYPKISPPPSAWRCLRVVMEVSFVRRHCVHLLGTYSWHQLHFCCRMIKNPLQEGFFRKLPEVTPNDPICERNLLCNQLETLSFLGWVRSWRGADLKEWEFSVLTDSPPIMRSGWKLGQISSCHNFVENLLDFSYSEQLHRIVVANFHLQLFT